MYLNHSEPSNLGYPIFRRNHLSARKSPASWPHPHLIITSIYQKASGWSYKTKGTHSFTNKCVWLIIVIKFPKINPFKKQRQHFFRLVVCSCSYYTPRKKNILPCNLQSGLSLVPSYKVTRFCSEDSEGGLMGTIPSSNQTWQRKIHLFWMIFLDKPPFLKDIEIR